MLKETTMGAKRILSKFNAEQGDDGVTLTLEFEDGSTAEFEASFEQIELMTDTLDDLLSANDHATEVAGDEEKV
jgi:hypothetical protein